MKNKYINILAATLLAGFASCNDEAWDSPAADKVGEVQLSTLNISLKDADRIVVGSNTRGDDIKDFKVTIRDNSNEGKIVGKVYTYGSMPEIVSLPVGDNYVVYIESHDVKAAEFDNPYYKGQSETFKIEAGKITRLNDIEAKFSSLKVTINYSDELKKILGSDAAVTVKGSNGSQLVFTPSETRSGYFALGESFTLAAHFEGSVDGVKTTTITTLQDVKEGDHHILTYSIKGTPNIPKQDGQIGKGDSENEGFNIDVTYEKTDIDSNTTIIEDNIDSSDRPGKEDPQEPDDNGDDDPGKEPGGEDNPGGNDDPNNPDSEPITFEAKDSPNLKLDGINIASVDFGNAIISISCPKGIKKFTVDIESTDTEGFLQAIKDENLDHFDLTNPGKAQQKLADLELPYGDEVKNKTSIDFNITSFIPLLLIYEGPSTHHFILTVQDNNDKVGNLNLTFQLN